MKSRRRYRMPYLRNPVTQIEGRLPVIQLPLEDRLSPGLLQRKEYYQSERWRSLRRRMLKSRDCRKCFFCGRWSNVLEHLVGHGADAVAVGHLFGMSVPETWEERFWTGPFVGSCDKCARQRTGVETAGRLHRWTKQWLESKNAAEKAATTGART